VQSQHEDVYTILMKWYTCICGGGDDGSFCAKMVQPVSNSSNLHLLENCSELSLAWSKMVIAKQDVGFHSVICYTESQLSSLQLLFLLFAYMLNNARCRMKKSSQRKSNFFSIYISIVRKGCLCLGTIEKSKTRMTRCVSCNLTWRWALISKRSGVADSLIQFWFFLFQVV
jgi:hypothetical protein